MISAAFVVASWGAPAPVFARDGGREEALARAAAGDSLRLRGEVERAKAEYRAALDADDESCEARFGLARLALLEKNVEEAEDFLEPCDEEKSEALFLLGTGLVLLERGKHADSEIALIKAATRIESGPLRAELERAFVALYVAKEVPRLAIDHLDQLIAVSPGDPAPHIEKGRLLVSIKEYDTALAAFRQAVALDSTAVAAHEEIATLYTRAKRPADAAAALERIAASRGAAADFLALGEARSAARETAKALEAYRRAAALDPDSDSARLGFARSAFESGARDTALAQYVAVKDSSRLTARDLESIGRVYLDRKEDPAARSAYLRAAAIDSTRADALFYAGYTFFAERNYAEAVPLFERRIAIDSTSAAAYANLGLSYLQTENFDRGIEMLEAACRLRPTDVQSRLWLAQALAARSLWPRAIEAYRAAIATDSSSAEAWRGLGYSLLNRERYDEAAVALARADRLEPRNVQGLIWLAQAFGLTGRLDDAEAAFKKALAVDPKSSDALAGLKEIERVNKGKKPKAKTSP
jgi:tetratricopeptide (TPR) repeat protein